MADGDAVLQDLVICKYLDDNQKPYLRKVFSFYQAQAALGWDIATSQEIIDYDYAPKGLKPRTWLVWNAADHTQRARVVMATNADYIAGTVGTTTVNVIYRGYSLTMTLYQREGERRRGKMTDTAVEAALPGI